MASLEKIMHEINALSSSAPCPHAERVKMLEEGWLHLTRQTPPETNHPGDTVSQEVQIKGTAKYHYPTDRWCQVYASWKPIRRRAGVEGK
jgi:hypothetical protein